MKLFLIDGHALVFKMYYAFLGRPMVNSKGIDTSILFGFTKYILELIDREKPTHFAVSFDPPGGTFRNVMYPEYKANRGETPQLVIDALEPLTAIVKAMDIPVLMIPGFEADDVIGSAAKRFHTDAMQVYMVTPDKDYGQLVEPGIYQYKPGKAGGDNELLGPDEICAKWGIRSTNQVIDILALCGDSADNVPGVPGVGPVGAAKLLQKYGSVEDIYAHLDELTAKQREKFEAARDHIGLSKELVTIKTDISLDITTEDLELRCINTTALNSLLNLYEMPSLRRLLARINCAEAGGADAGGTSPSPVSKSGAGHSVEPDKSNQEQVPEDSGQDAMDPSRISMNLHDGILYIFDGSNVQAGSPEQFRSILEDETVSKIGCDLKLQLNTLSRAGIEVKGYLEDIELMHYLLNPERSHKLDVLAKAYLGITLEEPEEVSGSGSLFDDQEAQPGFSTETGAGSGTLFGAEGSAWGLSHETVAARGLVSGCPAASGTGWSAQRGSLVGESPGAAARATEIRAIRRLGIRLSEELSRSENLKNLYDTIEEPLIGVLSRMELKGVKVDINSLRDFADGLRRQALEREKEVRELAGMPNLNVGSPKQIGEVIFEKLKLDPKARKPRSGNWPTDEQTLSELSDRSPIIEAILDYRGTRKLLSTYIEPFPSYIREDGRVHTTFNQALTSTGRLSSSNPNLQNIPIRTEQGREIRKAFVPQDSGSVMMSADYSQIELRIMAHLCGDEHLCKAFNDGIDIHSATAAKIFNMPVEEVSSQQRRMAKTVNFGIMYGISAFGLSQRLGCSRSEAKAIIDDYFASFPSIRGWIDSTLQSAREKGYVETVFGRRRYVPDVGSHNATVRALAERNAVNAPIQGTSADIIKIAMAGVDRRLKAENLRSGMVLQIHDELVLEVPHTEIEQVRQLLTEEMEGVIKLNVPLTVECNYGKTWLEAH